MAQGGFTSGFPARSVAALATIAVLLGGDAGPGTASDRPLIQEVLYDGPGVDAPAVFTEICGPPGMRMAGWKLVGVNGDNGATYRTIDLSAAVIPADGVLVVATSAATGEVLAHRDLAADVDWQNGPDAVQLLDPSGVLADGLQYGDAGTFNAGEGRPAPTTPAGYSLSRDSLGTDTQDNRADFTLLAVPTPGRGPVVSPGTAPLGLVVSVPDTAARWGSRVWLSVSISDPRGHGIVAVEVSVAFDRGLLAIDSVAAAYATPTSGWSLVHNLVRGTGTVDTLMVAMATGGDTLAGSGPLFAARFALAEVRRPTRAAVSLAGVLLNRGTPLERVISGGIRTTGTEAEITVTPARLALPGTLHVQVSDADENRDPAVADRIPVRLHVGTATDTIIAVETGPTTGLFVVSVPVVAGTAVAGDTVLQVQAGQTIQVRYADSLDATGSSVERSTDVVAGGGCDARLAATAVLQPGDTLRVLLADPDLGQGPLSQDSATVTVANRRTSEREVLVLRGLAAGDSVFVGQLPTTPQDGPSGDGLLGTRRADTLEVTYLDSEAASGQPVERHCATFVVDPLGDVDANGLVQAFDASRVLTHVLTPCLAGYDSLAANLDSLAPYGPITPTDAVLILQQRVGLRQRFPVQASGSLNVPQWNATVAAPRLVTVTRPASLAWEGGELVVRLADRSGIVAGQLDLEGIEGSVAMGQGMPAFVVVWDARGGRTRVALAGPTPVAATGTLVRLRATRIVGDIRLARAEFNDGRIAADPVDCPGGPIPLCFGLLPNYPNPMNPTTCIPFQVPEPIRVELSILNLAGQLVRTLVSQVVPAGTHVVSWNATDQADRSVGSGVYLCRMRAGSFGQTRRMVVLH